MSKKITIFKRTETIESKAAVNYPCDQIGFKITVSSDDGDDVLFEAETVEEGIESLTYSHVTPQELIAIGHKLIAAGQMFGG